MLYTPLTLDALKCAWEAHLGQLDKSGLPYIFHPYHLAEQMDDEVSCAAALLHDVVEDTDVTLEQLRQRFPAEVTDAVALLTHDKTTDYLDYVRALRANPVAKKVKLADLAHNSDQSRLGWASVSPEQLRRLREKYARAKELLEE